MLDTQVRAHIPLCYAVDWREACGENSASDIKLSMPWYKIVSDSSHVTTKRYNALMEIGKSRYKKEGHPKRFAICSAVELSKELRTEYSILYFSPIAVSLCRDILESEGAQLCVTDPSINETGLMCFGDFDSLSDLLK